MPSNELALEWIRDHYDPTTILKHCSRDEIEHLPHARAKYELAIEVRNDRLRVGSEAASVRTAVLNSDLRGAKAAVDQSEAAAHRLANVHVARSLELLLVDIEHEHIAQGHDPVRPYPDTLTGLWCRLCAGKEKPE